MKFLIFEIFLIFSWSNLSSSPTANLFFFLSTFFPKCSRDQNNFFPANSRHRAINFFLSVPLSPISTRLLCFLALLWWCNTLAWSSIWSKKRVNECVWHLAGCDFFFFFLFLHPLFFSLRYSPKRLHIFFLRCLLLIALSNNNPKASISVERESQTRLERIQNTMIAAFCCNIVSGIQTQSCWCSGLYLSVLSQMLVRDSSLVVSFIANFIAIYHTFLAFIQARLMTLDGTWELVGECESAVFFGD